MKYFKNHLTRAVFIVGTVALMTVMIQPAHSKNEMSMSMDMDMADSHSHHGMTMDSNGMVMNENSTNIPLGCEELMESASFHVIADSQAVEKVAGTTFSFFPRIFNVKPCTKITVTFENKDEVRHQWMVHGLPRFMYNGGMFHLEAYGGKTVVGTFIVPFDDKTYLIHCDISQHMQKGMKGMLTVGKGSGVISGIPGSTGYFYTGKTGFVSELGVVVCFVVFVSLLFFALKHRRD